MANIYLRKAKTGHYYPNKIEGIELRLFFKESIIKISDTEITLVFYCEDSKNELTYWSSDTDKGKFEKGVIGFKIENEKMLPIYKELLNSLQDGCFSGSLLISDGNTLDVIKGAGLTDTTKGILLNYEPSELKELKDFDLTKVGGSKKSGYGQSSETTKEKLDAKWSFLLQTLSLYTYTEDEKVTIMDMAEVLRMREEEKDKQPLMEYIATLLNFLKS